MTTYIANTGPDTSNNSNSQLDTDLATATRLYNVCQYLNPKDKLFAISLTNAIIHQKKGWSAKQRYWALEMEARALLEQKRLEEIKNARPPKQFPKIAALFAKALASGLSWPKITYEFPATSAEDLMEVVLAYNPKYNCISLKLNKALRGTIKLPSGLEDTRWPISDYALELLNRIEADPVAAATLHGKQTGCCSFCSKLLTDERSVVVGYGPICADKWGLPWGEDGKTGATLVSKKLDEEGI